MPTNDELVESIETSLFVLSLPGRIDALDVPGVRGRVTKLSHPIANLVGCADIATAEVDATIGLVRERYGPLVFGWVTGPMTRPHDLDRRLVTAEFKKAEEIAGMALTDLSTPIAAPPDVKVAEVGRDAVLAETEMMGRAYDLPPDVTRLFNEALFAVKPPLRGRGYFAYVDGRPVAWSFAIYLAVPTLVLLGGAATLSEFRGRGLYTALVARRLADARAEGRSAAIIQAARGTSAPICAKLGFQELCGLDLFVSPTG